MFCHLFKKKHEISPEFEVSSVPFRLSFNCPFISIEFRGKSVREQIYKISIVLNSKKEEFLFSFSLLSNSFSFPVQTDENSINLRVELEITNESSSKAPFRGLDNFGATCYINTLLETIYYIKEFKDCIYKSRGYNSRLLQRLFYGMDIVNHNMQLEEGDNSTGPRISNSTDDNLQVLRERLLKLINNLTCVSDMNTHQDIHEFSKFLFDNLENENKKEIKELIEGKKVALVKCPHGCVSKNYETFQDLSMVIVDPDTSEKLTSLGEALEQYCKETTINGFNCEKHGKVDAVMQVLFSTLPRALFLLINRFYCSDWMSENYVKINSFFEFPEFLDFSPFMEDCEHKESDESRTQSENSHEFKKAKKSPTKYILFSVMVHKGGVGKGHYYSHIRLGDKYYTFDDDRVYQCSKYEAVDWNFGGSHPNSSQEKNFSAYYLTYLRQEEAEQYPKFDVDELVDSTLIPELRESLESIFVKFISNSAVMGYMGPGRFNVSNYNYPIVYPQLFNCSKLDNVSKVFNKKTVFDPNFAIVRETAVEKIPYYVTSASLSGGKLVFVKLYFENPWCNYPTNLYSIGEKIVKKLSDFSKFTELDSYDIFIENSAKVEVVTDIKQLKHGDSIVIAPKDSFFTDFILRLYNHQLVNVSLSKNMNVPIFIEKNQDVGSLLENIQRNFHSKKISIIYDPEKPLLDEKNRVECKIDSGNLFHVGILSDGFDVNSIDHIHQFILPLEATASDLIRAFRSSGFVCMSSLQYLEDVQVLETVKSSVNAKILNGTEILESNSCYYVIQPKVERPLKVCFYKGNYELLNYPFFIENPGTIKKLREKYFFLNRIFRFNGSSYVECLVNDQISSTSNDILLIESK